MEKVKDKFLRYIKIDTKSDPDSKTAPSSKKQFDLAIKLKAEMEMLGLNNITLSDKCYLSATLPANTDKEIPVVGFISHLDTSPDTPGNGVTPQIIENYDGEDIILSHDDNIILSPDDFPDLRKYIGQTIIATNGKTLLGADDKAGIAEIMSAVEFLVNNPDIIHGKIKIAFTPDEEIGRGADHFNVEKFGADFAYTVDGGEIGELEFENFNAASLEVNIQGRNVHPGTAKNQMINAIQIANLFNSMLPQNQKPEHTDGYDGFFHPVQIKGTIDNAKIEYIIRDHDKAKFETKKQIAYDIAQIINKIHNKNIITLNITDSYYNMSEKIKPVMHIVEYAKKAMEDAGIKPIIKPIRGGTDGSKLSFMGLPCPNIFTGGHNFHGIYEYIPVNSMEKASEVIINICKNLAK